MKGAFLSLSLSLSVATNYRGTLARAHTICRLQICSIVKCAVQKYVLNLPYSHLKRLSDTIQFELWTSGFITGWTAPQFNMVHASHWNCVCQKTQSCCCRLVSGRAFRPKKSYKANSIAVFLFTLDTSSFLQLLLFFILVISVFFLPTLSYSLSMWPLLEYIFPVPTPSSLFIPQLVPNPHVTTIPLSLCHFLHMSFTCIWKCSNNLWG